MRRDSIELLKSAFSKAPPPLLYRLVIPASLVKVVSQDVVKRDGQRIEFYASLFRHGNRFVEPLGNADQVGAVEVVGGRVIRIQLDGPLELALRPRPIPVVNEFHQSQGGVRLGEALVKFQRLERRWSAD